MLLTLALFSILVVGVLAAWRHSQQVYFHGAEAAQVQQNARAAVEQMIREIRQAKGLTTAEANRLTITSVLDENSRTYELSASPTTSYRYTLLYTKPGPPGPNCTTPCPIADYLVTGTPLFTYRRADRSVITPPVTAAARLAIKQIDVTVQVQPALADADPPFAPPSDCPDSRPTLCFSSSTRLRNR
ncbi:MAG: PilW family protein [Candidatus Rokuibacteriota bacterium]